MEDFSDLFDFKTAEETEFDDLSLTRIDILQAIQSFIERDEIIGKAITRARSSTEIVSCGVSYVPCSAAAFLARLLSRRVDEDSSHDLRRYREKMMAILPFRMPRPKEV